MAALIIAIFPQNSSRGNWEEQQDRTDPNSQFELARKPAWLLAFRQFGLPKWKHDFESCAEKALAEQGGSKLVSLSLDFRRCQAVFERPNPEKWLWYESNRHPPVLAPFGKIFWKNARFHAR